MKILVIAGYCLKVNSSANLCHARYIDGMLQAGHEVDLLTVSEKNLNIDASIKLPNVHSIFEYDASLYERIGARKKTVTSQQQAAFSNEEQNFSQNSVDFKQKIKSFIRSLYGVYGTDAVWLIRARRFRSNTAYDLVISLSDPPVSHKLAEILIKRKRICTKKWIQIWEDPWYADLCGMTPTKKIWNEEEKILNAAEIIYYVSPLTLQYQKIFFPKSAEKMKWQPLPSYYSDSNRKPEFHQYHFGYFGDYSENVRNLRVFYEYAVENGLRLDICGNASAPYISENKVCVYPRMPLDKLHQYEQKTNVLVSVCNRKGGQIPGKIYQYSATDKYILFILDGSEEEIQILRNYFEKFNRYVFCYNNADSIKEAITRIESGKLPDTYRTPLDSFAPKKIVESIIKGE